MDALGTLYGHFGDAYLAGVAVHAEVVPADEVGHLATLWILPPACNRFHGNLPLNKSW